MKHRIKRAIAYMLLMILVLSTVSVHAADSLDKTILYISVDGSDSNTGSIDSPFASFAKARDTIREMKQAGTLGKDGAIVYVRGGNYLLQKGVTLTEEDSGTETAPIVYRNYPGEKPVLKGAIDVDFSEFQPLKDQELIKRLPSASIAEKVVSLDLFSMGITDIPEPEWMGVYTYEYDMPTVMGKSKPNALPPELIVNDKVQTVASYPNGNGMLTIDEVIDSGEYVRNWWQDMIGTDAYTPPEKRTKDPMIFKIVDNRLKRWSTAEELLVYGTFNYDWADQTVPVAEINPETLVVTTKFPSTYGVIEGQEVRFYNLFEEIDIPGEYYINRQTGKLYYYPVNETIDKVQLTLLEDYVFTLNSVEHVSIKGLTMSYVRAGMIQTTNCRNVEVLDCEMAFSGRKAMNFINANECRIANNYIHDVEGGLYINGGDEQTLTPANNIIENNEFYFCDRLTKAGNPAIGTNGVGHIIRFNKIGKGEQMVVNFLGNDNQFIFNEVYDAVQNTDDVGALYAGRCITHRGNKIMYNYWHDLGGNATNWGVQAVFLDDFWSWAHISGNVFENIQGQAIRLAGSHNAITNNLFINNDDVAGALDVAYPFGQPYSSNNDFFAQLEKVPYQGEIWTSKYPEIANVIDEKGWLDMNHNITVTNNVLYRTKDFDIIEQIYETATVEDNVQYMQDPGFVDIDNRNYTLKPDSKIFKDIEGFMPIPFTRMGMYTERALHRVKDSTVFALNSPLVITKGKATIPEIGATTFGGKVYVPVRLAGQIFGADVHYDAETNMVAFTGKTIQLQFSNSDTSNIQISGSNAQLADGILQKDGTNYLSVHDLAECFEKSLVEIDDVYVLTDDQELLDKEGDAELVRYYRDILSIY